MGGTVASWTDLVARSIRRCLIGTRCGCDTPQGSSLLEVDRLRTPCLPRQYVASSPLRLGAGSSHLYSSLRRNHSAGELHRIDDVGVDTAIGSRLSLGDHGLSPPTTGQRHRRALTYPYPSHLLLEGASSTHLSNTLTLTSTPDPPREAGPSGSHVHSSCHCHPCLQCLLRILPEQFNRGRTLDILKWTPRRRGSCSTISGDRPGHSEGRSRQLRAFFGYGAGNRARKEFVQLIWTLAFGFVQVRIPTIDIGPYQFCISFSVTISFMSLAAVRK